MIDYEFNELVGLDLEDIRVHYRGAFVTLMQAVNQRDADELNDKPVDAAQYQEQMELVYQQIKQSRALLEMLDS
jgi:hypothetical protein